MTKSRVAFIALLAACAAGCAATAEDVRNNLGSRYVGQNVDMMVARFGPPASSFKMHSGDASYLWQLGSETHVRANEHRAVASSSYCRVNVIASSNGTIKSLTTEDASNLLGESLCAEKLGMLREMPRT